MENKKELRRLCRRGKFKKILTGAQSTGSTEVLRQGFDPDLSQPLHYAAARGNIEAVRELIESYGCDPGCQNLYGITPMHCASYCGRLNVVKYLQKCCADTATIGDREGACPLVYSAYCTMENVTMRAPLDHIQRVTPRSDHFRIAKFLLTCRAPKYVFSPKVSCILRLPLYCGSLTDLRHILGGIIKFVPHAESVESNLEVYECLNIAFDRKKWDFAESLLRHFPGPIKTAMSEEVSTQAHSMYRFTPFHKACNMGADADLVKIFLELDICKPCLL